MENWLNNKVYIAFFKKADTELSVLLRTISKKKKIMCVCVYCKVQDEALCVCVSLFIYMYIHIYIQVNICMYNFNVCMHKVSFQIWETWMAERLR